MAAFRGIIFSLGESVMDLSSPKTWQDGMAAVIGAPHVAIPLVILVMGCVWWLRGRIERSARDGLNAQMAALRERLQLAHDQHAAVTSKLEIAKRTMAALQEKVGQASSEPTIVPQTAVKAIADTDSALQMADAANSALSYVLRTAVSDAYTEKWRDHAITAALVEKVAFAVEYEDGRTARMFVSQWDVRSGDDAIGIIAGDRQREGSLPKGKIKKFKREPDG